MTAYKIKDIKAIALVLFSDRMDHELSIQLNCLK